MTRDFRTSVPATTQGAPVANQKATVTCYEYGKQGHYRSECSGLKNQNRRNQARNGEARGRAYALGGGEPNQNPNIVIGTFLLNNNYASILFDTSADRSFVSTTFSPLIEITPTTLDTKYVIENSVVSTSSWYRLVDKVLRRHHMSHSIQKYIQKGHHVFLAQITEKKTEKKSEEKRLEDVLIMCGFLEIFPKDLAGLPLTRQIEFQIYFVPGVAPVALSPYRLAPSDMQELSN
ncbi:hypothetical protein Tco_0680068 [Tanacetum coccineum]|uniref:Reverse transcriptase domain-containing protein n=1 Tax=Tanacetum coccineum TaxID=301880 RepID=A0ABQ4XJS9_9ASTR